jgi:uncharacterized damage-inducible protein DinB
MRQELDAIIKDIDMVLFGEPWFGRSLFSLLADVHPADVFKKPNEEGHSLIELVYHMVTWADFTLHRLRGDKEKDLKAFEELDWRNIDPQIHSWSKGLSELESIHQKIIVELKGMDDSILDKKVDYREYNFRFLLKGLIQHDIYHLGQIAYVTKWLIPK